MFSLIRKRMKGEKGFTLIELLVVIIIIAILAAIAIPTFLGQRQKAQDAAAKSLVRNAMTAIESAYVDLRTFAPASMTDAVLTAIEPSIDFVTGTATVAGAVTDTSTAATNKVEYFGEASTYSAGSRSESGKEFSVFVNKTATAVGANLPGNTFYIDADVKPW